MPQSIPRRKRVEFLKVPSLRLYQFLVMVTLFAVSQDFARGQEEAIFADDFDRGVALVVGNNWETKGTIVLQNKAALFQPQEEEFRPRMRHSFPPQTTGKIQATFRFDWLREAEGTWAFYMQLGDSTKIPRFLIRKTDLSKGMQVNLLWGGGDPVKAGAKGTMGYLKDGDFKPLLVVNDSKNPQSVIKAPVVTVDIDLDSSMYAVTINGKTYTRIPFDNQGPIDTIRFITDGCSASGFSKSSIDDVTIRSTK